MLFNNISYIAIFFEDKDTLSKIKSLEREPLPITNDILHCTLKYHPKENELFPEIIGKEFTIKLTGYASNGKNSGFEIELPTELEKYYINYDEVTNKLKTPHITTSISEGAKAKNTKDLNFIPLPKTEIITGKVGYWIKENNKEYISYEK